MSILTGKTHTSVLQKCGTEIRKPCFDHIFITEKQVHSVQSWMEYSPAVFIRFLTNFREQVKSSLQIPGIGFSTQQKCYMTIIWIQMMPVIPCVMLWWPEMKRCVLWWKSTLRHRIILMFEIIWSEQVWLVEKHVECCFPEHLSEIWHRTLMRCLNLMIPFLSDLMFIILTL